MSRVVRDRATPPTERYSYVSGSIFDVFAAFKSEQEVETTLSRATSSVTLPLFKCNFPLRLAASPPRRTHDSHEMNTEGMPWRTLDRLYALDGLEHRDTEEELVILAS